MSLHAKSHRMRRLNGQLGFKRWNYRPRRIIYNMYWEFNPYDDDDHPYVPHGNSLNHRYSIDLRNGDVYQKRELVGHLSKKDFNMLKSDKLIHEVILTAQQYYREHHPEINFDRIPWLNETVTTSKVLVRQKRDGTKKVYMRLKFVISTGSMA